MFVGLRGGEVAPTAQLTCQITDTRTRRGPRTNDLFGCPTLHSVPLSFLKLDSGPNLPS